MSDILRKGSYGTSITGSDTNLSSTSSSSTSIIKSLKQSFTTYSVVLQDREKLKGWQNVLLFAMLHFYTIWASLSIPSQGSYNYGEIGSWIWKAFNYPVTLSLDLIPYEVAIALSSISVAFSVLGVLMFLVSSRAVFNSSRYTNTLKKAFRIYGILFQFCVFTMIFIMAGFFDCDQTRSVVLDGYDDAQIVLRRYNTVPCSSTTNIVMIIVNAVGILLLFINSLLVGLTVTNAHPKSSTLFIADTSYLSIVFNWISMFQILIVYLIPRQYFYVVAILHMVTSLLYIPMLFHFLPFFTRVENSIYCGIGFSKVGISIGCLISFFVNGGTLTELGLGMSGLMIGLGVLGFLFGFTVMEIYTRVIYNEVRKEVVKILVECASQALELSNDGEVDIPSVVQQGHGENFFNLKTLFERESISLLRSFEERKKLRNLNLFLKFSMRSGHKPTKETFLMSDLDLVVAFIRGVGTQKSFSSPTLLINCSLVACHFVAGEANNFILAFSLLRKALKQRPSLLISFAITERMKEIESSTENGRSKSIMEIKHILHRLEKNKAEILALHRQFWKELMSDMVNTKKLILVTERISKLTTLCHTVLENLSHEFSNDKTVLRFYAGFMEDVLFNSEYAQEMYTDASLLEEEDSKRVEMTITKSHRRIVPLSETVDTGSFNERVEKTKESFMENRKRSSVEIGSVNLFDERESDIGADAFENPLVKKESMFKLALQTPVTELAQTIIFYSWTGLMFCLLLTGFIMSVQFSITALTEVPKVKTTCKTLISPISSISDIRMKQLLISAFNDSKIKAPTPSLTKKSINSLTDFERLFTERITSHNKALEDLSHLASFGELSDAILTDYKTNRFTLKLPEIPHGSLIENYDGFFETNSSVTEISQAIIRYSNTLLYTNKTAIETTTDYSFMFFWYNKYILQDSLEGFCYEFIRRSQEQIGAIQFSFMVYLIVSSSCISIISTMVISFFVYKSFFIDGSIRLFSKSLAKDVIGKIYHKLGKIVNEGVSTHVSKHSLFRPRNLIVLFGIVLTLILIASNGLFYVQVILNCRDGNDVMDDVKNTVLTMHDIQNVQLFVGEIYIFGIYPNNSLVNPSVLMEHEEMLELHNGLIDVSTELLNLWNLLVFGDYSKGLSPILLRYGKVDDMIQGHGCTQIANSTEKTCQGLDELIKGFVLSSREINERANNKGPENYVQTFEDLIKFYFDTNKLTTDLYAFLDIFVSNSQADLMVSILVFVVACLSMSILTVLMNNALDKTEYEVNLVRALLNYVPVENLDAKEELRTFVLHNSLPSLVHRHNSDSNDDNVRNMLNATVDGAVMCNDKGDIEIFNPAASRIHGRQVDEVLGRPFWFLFDSKYHDEIKLLMSLMIKGHHLNHAGEKKEVEGLRKNGTKFPAVITISGTTYDSNVIYICFIKDISSEKKQNALLAEEKKKSEKLLKNILPSTVAQKLKAGETFIAEKFQDVTCFFSDMVGFTSISSKMGANELVGMLNSIVNGLDSLTEKYDLEKIKTIGDAYFCVGGLWQTSDHPERVLMFALDSFYVIRTYNTNAVSQHLRKADNLDSPDIYRVPQIDIRIGINTGECIAGVIGTKKFAYDLWGDTINVSSRMESTSKPGQIQISRSTFERVHDLPKLKFEERSVEVKGKGKMQSYLVDSSCHISAKLNEETIQELAKEEMGLRNDDPRESYDMSGGNNFADEQVGAPSTLDNMQ